MGPQIKSLRSPGLNHVMIRLRQRERLKLLKSEKVVEKPVAVNEYRRNVFGTSNCNIFWYECTCM